MTQPDNLSCALAHTEFKSIDEEPIWKVCVENYPRGRSCSGWIQFACITPAQIESTNFYSLSSAIISDTEFSSQNPIEIVADLKNRRISSGGHSYQITVRDATQPLALAILTNYSSNNIPGNVKISLL